MGSVLSEILDRPKIVRTLMLASLAPLIGLLQPIFMRMLVSKFMWQRYPAWSVILHAPLLTQVWVGKILFDWLRSKYIQLENHVITLLADAESALTEPNLKVDS
jgi:hypothetical protein